MAMLHVAVTATTIVILISDETGWDCGFFPIEVRRDLVLGEHFSRRSVKST